MNRFSACCVYYSNKLFTLLHTNTFYLLTPFSLIRGRSSLYSMLTFCEFRVLDSLFLLFIPEEMLFHENLYYYLEEFL